MTARASHGWSWSSFRHGPVTLRGGLSIRSNSFSSGCTGDRMPSFLLPHRVATCVVGTRPPIQK
uniref:Predicted protein n=1 Tax=Hordeum vulgare subsp. vulgare TaxID=112509 RepID=F2CTW6_HORVV|nr:predicted protein [Hordeum vulgare subsp. vulgare]